MTTSFGRLLKRWIIAALCVALLGGGISTVLLAPQIREIISVVQTIHQQKDQWEHDDPGDDHDRGERHRDRFDAEDVFRASVTRPSAAAVVSMGSPPCFAVCWRWPFGCWWRRGSIKRRRCPL